MTKNKMPTSEYWVWTNVKWINEYYPNFCKKWPYTFAYLSVVACVKMWNSDVRFVFNWARNLSHKTLCIATVNFTASARLLYQHRIGITSRIQFVLVTLYLHSKFNFILAHTLLMACKASKHSGQCGNWIKTVQSTYSLMLFQ